MIEHGSSSVAFVEYKPLLEEAAKLLPLYGIGPIIFLADRGFADTEWMRFLTEQLHWQWRIRIKRCFKVYRPQHTVCKLSRYAPKAGEAYFWHAIRITDERFGPVHLAMAQVRETKERWYVLSSSPTSLTTFDEYGLRFDIEENFLDDKTDHCFHCFFLCFTRHSFACFLSYFCLTLYSCCFSFVNSFFPTFVSQAGLALKIVSYCSLPRPRIGQVHSTRPLRTPTSMSWR